MKTRTTLVLAAAWLALFLRLHAAEPPPLAPGARVDCAKLAFQPQSWKERGLSLDLVPWTGSNVVFLTTREDLDPALMGLWVSRLDAGWTLYADLTGRLPTPFRQLGGKATVAAVPDAALTCGAGCGYVGATGIELALFYDHDYPNLKARPRSMPHYAFYEMGRNFYTFGGRHGCFVTGFAVFMRYVCMDGLGFEDTDAGTRATIEAVEPRLSGSGLGFLELFTTGIGIGEKAHLVKDAAGKVIYPSDQPVRYATAMLRLRRENGGDAWLRRFYRELALCPEFKSDTRDGALAQSWHWLLCASVAAGKDLSPVFAGEWHLPLAAETRAALAGVDWKKPGLDVRGVATAITPVWSEASDPAKPASDPAPRLVPMPKDAKPGTGSAKLGRDSRIVAASPELVPLAGILSGEIDLAFGVAVSTEPRTPNGRARPQGYNPPADIVLKLDPALPVEAYRLDVADGIAVAGADYDAVASGTATLLQLLRRDGDGLVVPRIAIEDEPVHAYRGALLDLARKYHSPGGIEQVVELCRLYKIRYLQLHLTDDQLFMFPSARFPGLGKGNREFARFEPASKPRIAPYTADELRSLERFARDRGVHLVPEIDLPGHSGRLVADAPEIFGIPGNGSTVNIASPKTFEALSALLNEAMDIFASSPYVHLGADEVGLGGLDQTTDYREAKARLGVKDVHDLYCRFVADLQGVVAKRGKKAIVWEEAWNPDSTRPLPKDTLVMVWSQGRDPNAIVRSGYTVVNATWTPLYIVRDNKKSLDFLAGWSVSKFGREGSESYTTLPDTAGVAGAQLCSWENSESIEIQSLRDRLALVAERTWNPGAAGDPAGFRSRLAHTDALLEKLIHPVSIRTTGKFAPDENTFVAPFELTLVANRPGHTIRYTLDNSLPNGRWSTYTGPIAIDRTVHVRAGLFDAAGTQEGYLSGAWFRSRIPAKPNLATGRPVTVGPSPDRTDAWSAKVAVDGKADDAGGHWASEGPAPQWLRVDLGSVVPVDTITVVTYWDGGRYYQWNAEVSEDGRTWRKAADFSTNRVPATERGYTARFPATNARHVRVNMLKNSANPFVHIVELIVDGPGPRAEH